MTFPNLLLCLLVFQTTAYALNNGLGRTPQMGYNSWYDAECSENMNEEYITAQVDAFVEQGFPQIGYSYFNLDDCIVETNRSSAGELVPDQKRFPSGLKNLAAKIHALDIKFGVYTDRGNKTCAGRAGALGKEAVDAATYAEWGVDYLKEDSCYGSTDHKTAFSNYGKMRDALNKTGREIFFSLCGWEDWYAPVGQSLGNSWRIGPDDSNWQGILTNTNIMARLAQYAGPGGWNDPCLLLSQDSKGNFRVSELQSRAQFGLWAVMGAPLLISGRIVNMTASNFETYTNPEVIAVSQDPLGRVGTRVEGGDLPKNSTTNVWARTLANGDVALLFLNVGPDKANVTCGQECLQKAGLIQAQTTEITETDSSSKPVTKKWVGRDLWKHQDLSSPLDFNGVFREVEPEGGSVLIRWSSMSW